MSFSVTISGHVDDPDTAPGVEQEIIADLRAVVAKHADHISLASASFQYEGSVDLRTSDTSDPRGTPGTGGFVTKLEGESFTDYQARLFTFNASVPEVEQAPSLTLEEWTALPVG